MAPAISDMPDGGSAPSATADPRAVVKDLHSLPSHKIIDRILESEHPEKTVQGLPAQDFFWLVKKIGTDDCLPLLQLASADQWQYLLDLDLWSKDRLVSDQSAKWLHRLLQADLSRLVRWLLSDAQPLAFLHFFRNLEWIIAQKPEDAEDLPAGFFTLDGVFYLRVTDPNQREIIERILREMADHHFERYQAFLLALGNVLPTEMEEQMYRVRNVRLAEHGFLPFEEAISVYAPLPAESLAADHTEGEDAAGLDDEVRAMVPATPMEYAGTRNLLTEAAAGISDPVFLDRLRLEFAGLCNQLFSADGIPALEVETLTEICRRAASYVNLAIEKASGRNTAAALDLLRSTHLLVLFRVGFGLALKVRWEAERWVAGSWFRRQGLAPGFWGEGWGGRLAGLLQSRPQYLAQPARKEGYKDFEWLSELTDCLMTLKRLMVLDSLLERLSEQYGSTAHTPAPPEATLYPFLFNLWGRSELGLKPSLSGLSPGQIRRLFEKLRGRGRRPPYRMPRAEARFTRFFIANASCADNEAASTLQEALGIIFQEFTVEYERVALESLAGRYMRFFTVAPIECRVPELC